MHETHFLSDILILLTGAVGIVAIMRLLKMSPVLGYFFAGIALGPYGFSLIQDITTASSVAELGVVFLLFMIGLELNFDRLKSLRRQIFGLGSAQVILTGFALGGTVLLLGEGSREAFIIGAALALSSTAVVLQVIAERGEQSTQVGRLSLAILLLQDFAVVPLLVILPILAAGDGSLGVAIGIAGVKAVIAMGVIFLAGHYLLRPLFRIIASTDSSDLFAATTLLIALGAAWMTDYFGLSLALGAFLAGIMISETEYANQVRSEVRSYKELLMGLFFMVVGMQIDFDIVSSGFIQIITFSILLIIIKTSIIVGICLLIKLPKSVAIQTGLLLSQGGEFAFVLFNMAMEGKLLSTGTAQILMVVITLTMAITPILAMLGRVIAEWLDKDLSEETTAEEAAIETADLSDHVIIVGYGRVGRIVSQMLQEEAICFVAVDLDADNVKSAKEQGLPVYYGDGSHMKVLEAMGRQHARAVIVTTHETAFSESCVKQIRQFCPELPIIARAIDRAHKLKLKEAGANVVIPEAFEASLQIGASLLRYIGTPEHEILRLLEICRQPGYDEMKVRKA